MGPGKLPCGFCVQESGNATLRLAVVHAVLAGERLDAADIALGGCMAVDVIEILQKKRQDVTDYRVEVSGERREEFPRAFTKLFVHHIVRGRNIAPQTVSQAVKLSEEKYCSVSATLKPTAEVITSFAVIEEAA